MGCDSELKRDHTVAFIGRRPKNFGGYKLDWSDVENMTKTLIEGLHARGYDYIVTDGCQGVAMIVTKCAMEAHESVSSSICPQLFLPIKDMSERWSPDPRDKFGKYAWKEMVSDLVKMAGVCGWWGGWRAVRYVQSKEKPSVKEVMAAYHATHEQMLTHSSMLIAYWPSEQGNWRDWVKKPKGHNSGTAACIWRAVKLGKPVTVIETETIDRHVTVKRSYQVDLCCGSAKGSK